MSNEVDFGSQLHHLVSLMSHESDQLLLEQLGIGLAQYKILRVVKTLPHIQQRAIAHELGQTEASISRQVKLLQGKMMLISRINPENHREHLTDLTDRGLRTVIAAETIIAKYHASLVSGLHPKQIQQLNEFLSVIHDEVCSPAQHVPRSYGEMLQGL